MKISNLQKSFGRFSLNIEDLTLTNNKITGLIGPNGCGKSTFAKILAGLIRPDSGTIEYDGIAQKDITLVPQKPYIMRDTVLANLTYPLKVRKIKPSTELINHYLELAGMENLKHAYAPGLSSGEGQKLALIRAMIFSPKLIFIDETFSNTDMESQARFEQYILEGQKSNPITWVIISHQLAVIKRMSSYVFFMHDGKIEEQGPTKSILANPKTPHFIKYLNLMNRPTKD